MCLRQRKQFDYLVYSTKTDIIMCMWHKGVIDINQKWLGSFERQQNCLPIECDFNE